MTPGAGSGEVRSPWDCGHVTQVEGSGEVGHPGECGCVAPRYRVWGLCGSHHTCMGQDHMYGETAYALFACSVSCPL